MLEVARFRPSARKWPPALLLALLLGAPTCLSGQGHEQHGEAPGGAQVGRVPLLDNLGTHHYAIRTDAPEAQEYFDQGLRLYYAFNHQEAIRAFREAQRIDADCAMCWWGEALAWGPNINLPMDSAAGVAARAAVDRALTLRDGAAEKERALIEALDSRYAAEPPSDRSALDSAYARAMAKLARSHPDDDEIAVLHSESLMDLRPWDYWTADGELQPGMPEALAGLEGVLRRNADHPGACHFFIHAVEKVHPERAVPCAERLAALMPGAGHLVHMPGHIYIRVGRYQEAIDANRHAVHADETYIQDLRPGLGMYTAGYYPHNYDFMAFAATMVGQSALAVEAADKMASLIPEEMLETPGLTFLQHYLTRPLQVRVRFERWSEILASPAPSQEFPHARAMWNYARGRALVGTGELDAAREELARVRAAAVALEGTRLEFNAADAILRIASSVLAGRLAQAQGHGDEAVASLTDAVRREDALLYGEPPEWTVPVRQELGEVLLDLGRFVEAEGVFRDDLQRFPENGWSLYGLAVSLEGQGRNAEASAVRERFRLAWPDADVQRSEEEPPTDSVDPA